MQKKNDLELIETRFDNIPKYSVFTGSTDNDNGQTGLVPSPIAGESDTYLKADGTWSSIRKINYPVGSIYQSVNPTSPAIMFGGEWEMISVNRTLMGTDNAMSVGTTIDAGLPDIAGTASPMFLRYYNDSTSTSGALSVSGSGSIYICRDSSTSYNYNVLNFNASKSNSIYGNSYTVQPAAYYVYIWEKKGYVLTLTADKSSTIVLTNLNNKIKYTVDDSEKVIIELPNAGIWTINVSQNDVSQIKTLNIDKYGYYIMDFISPNIFGVMWDYNSDSTALTRLTIDSDPNNYVNVNIDSEPVPAVDASDGSSPFDQYAPWNNMTEYNMYDNIIIAKYGDLNFDRNKYDTMVYVPEYYYKVIDDSDNSKRYFYISDRYVKGFEKHPGSGRYIARYNTITETNATISRVYSRSNKSPTVNNNRLTLRTLSAAKGNNWGLYDYASWCAIALLYLVEYADWDSQTKIGYGIASNSVTVNGKTDIMNYHTGRVTIKSTTNAVQYRHIENPWGNVTDMVDGININNDIIYISTNPSQYKDNTTDNYINIGSKVKKDGYTSKLGFSNEANWALYPSEANGTSSTYIPDKCYGNTTGWKILCVGGNYDNKLDAGLFHFRCNQAYNTNSAWMGSRLMYTPVNK